MYNHRSYFNFEAGRGSIYKSPPKTKPKTNPGKQFADSMKAAGIGSIGGKPTTSAAKKIQDRFRKQAQKDNNKGSTYDEIALPSEKKIDKKIIGLGTPDKPDDDKQDQSPLQKIKSTFESVSTMMGLGKPEEPKTTYKPEDVYSTAAFRARSKDPIIDIAAQNRRIDAALDFENRQRMYSFPVGGTYDEIKKQKGADERNQKKMAEAINATIEQLYAANDPARQFYQSGVPMEQRLFAPELGYDEIALPSEATIDKKIKGLGARPEVTVTELDYTVQQGDTVSEIAQQFGTTVEEILKLNKDIEDKDVIKTGQEIKLPVDAITAATKEIEEKTNQFINDIGTYAEDDHGDTPVVTADAKEANLTDDKKSLDIGYGHKIRRGSAEDTSGLIYGIKYKNADGSYIPLTEAQKRFILKKDYEKNAELALKKGWNRKLKERGTSWDNLDYKYRNALSSLAFNVGGAKAGEDWTQVLQAAKDKDPVEFARELRRKDAGENTAGMDNRVMKELYYAGIIKNRSEVASVLPEADARSGVPR